MFSFPFSETHHGRSCTGCPWGFSRRASERAPQSRRWRIWSPPESGLNCLPPVDDVSCDVNYIWKIHLKKLCHGKADSGEPRDVIVEEGGSWGCLSYSPEHRGRQDDDLDDHDDLDDVRDDHDAKDDDDYLHQSTSSPTERGRGKRFGKTPLDCIVFIQSLNDWMMKTGANDEYAYAQEYDDYSY